MAAEIRTRQQRYAEAEKLHREALAKNPESVLALNNLAVLLATQAVKLDEAAEHIEHAIRIADAQPALLDSRATVRLAQGKYNEALADSQKAVAAKATGIRCFHLALAYDALGQTEEARGTLQRAESLGLDAQKLPPLERASYQALRGKLLPE